MHKCVLNNIKFKRQKEFFLPKISIFARIIKFDTHGWNIFPLIIWLLILLIWLTFISILIILLLLCRCRIRCKLVHIRSYLPWTSCKMRQSLKGLYLKFSKFKPRRNGLKSDCAGAPYFRYLWHYPKVLFLIQILLFP